MKDPNKKYIIIIPARGGSKRLPRKNIIELCGKPLISYTIEYACQIAQKNPNIQVWLNTDDIEIIKVCSHYPIKIYERPEEFARDESTTVSVLKNQIEYMERNSLFFDSVILLQPTNPLRSIDLIDDAISLFESNDRNSLATFSLLNRKYGRINNKFYIPLNYQPGQRHQDIDHEYYENGLLYITKCNAIKNDEILTKDVYPLVTNDIYSSIDIDELKDLYWAEFVINKFDIC